MQTLLELTMIEMARNGLNLDANDPYLAVIHNYMSMVTDAGLNSMMSFVNTQIGGYADAEYRKRRARRNWQRFAVVSRGSIRELRQRWHANTHGMSVMRGVYNNDFLAFARDYYGT